MDKKFSTILNGVVGISAAAVLWSCAAENPFDSEGTGTLQLRTVVNHITTRAESGDPLKDNCVVYISRKGAEQGKSLVYKKVGLHNVDPQITLSSGSYIAEAWTGDSVPASFDKMFFRGMQEFSLTKGSTENVVLDCKIANVVVSVNPSTIDPNLMLDDYRINVSNSRGELTFDKSNVTEKAYFMMPNGDDSIDVSITGNRKDGKPFSKQHTIRNVERAHNYILNFDYNPGAGEDPTTGSVFLKLIIKDEVIDNSDIQVHTRPTVSGIGFDIERQLNYSEEANIPDNLSVQVCTYGPIKDLRFTSEPLTLNQLLGASEFSATQKEFSLIKASGAILAGCSEHGLEYTTTGINAQGVETGTISFNRQLLASLPESDTEYVFAIKAIDETGLETEGRLCIARAEAAVKMEDPIVVDPVDPNDFMAVKANSVTFNFTLAGSYEGTPGIEYAKTDGDDWKFAAANIPAASPRKAPKKANKKYSVTISGLEAGTTYKYRAVCGDFVSEQVHQIETYHKFIIPNWDMEKWGTVNGVGGSDGIRLPTRTGGLDFWGNGNPGAKKAGEILTDASTQMYHSPNTSARLESKFASIMGIGKFAAGNLFAGVYVKTDGTDGELVFGQPIEDFCDGKKTDRFPTALRVFVNYRPGQGVKGQGANDGYIKEGELDKAQIYVAMATDTIQIRTKKKNQRLFNKDYHQVVAYGEKTFDNKYGPDGQLQELIIPLDYNDRANGVVPSHLVIVCSASKFGDFFSGGVGSTMYLDDFELIYE